MKKYKLIAIDIDGTLVNDEKIILEETKKSIIKAHNNGVKIVIATGRSYPAAKKYYEQFDFNIPLILYNGAMIRMSKDNDIIYNKTFTLTKAEEIFNIINKYNATCCFWSKDKLYFNRENEYSHYYERITTIKPNIIYDFNNGDLKDINKFIWFNNGEILEKVKHEILCNVSDINYFKSQKEMLEIVPSGISKGNTLGILANSLGIDKSYVIAIGDDENDISMIEYAGMGVAMENAKEAVKSVADYITLSNELNGVGHVIDEFILKTEEDE